MAFQTPTVEYKTLPLVQEDNARIAQRLSQTRAVGIDTETRPAFRSGEAHPPATLQIATHDWALVLSINRAKTLPACLVRLLADSTILKFGCGIESDVRHFLSYYPVASVDAVLAGCVDLSLFAALTGRVEPSQPYGLKRLAEVFGQPLTKPKRVQMSRWDRVPLAMDQVAYAAQDAAIAIWLAAMVHGSAAGGDSAALCEVARPYAGRGGPGLHQLLKSRSLWDGLPESACEIIAGFKSEREAATRARALRKQGVGG